MILSCLFDRLVATDAVALAELPVFRPFLVSALILKLHKKTLFQHYACICLRTYNGSYYDAYWMCHKSSAWFWKGLYALELKYWAMMSWLAYKGVLRIPECGALTWRALWFLRQDVEQNNE